MTVFSLTLRILTLALPAMLLVVLADHVLGRRLTEHSPTVCDPVDVAAVEPEADNAGALVLEWILLEAERQNWVNKVERGLWKK